MEDLIRGSLESRLLVILLRDWCTSGANKRRWLPNPCALIRTADPRLESPSENSTFVSPRAKHREDRDEQKAQADDGAPSRACTL